MSIDASQMENALLNLVINARDAMPERGNITIEANNRCFEEDVKERDFTIPPGNYVSVAVSDSGSGMQSEILDRVFEPFFTTKEVGSGTGLGLSMVYGFTKQSGGYVKINSQPGGGTTVTLFLPETPAGTETEHDIQVAV